LKPQSAFSRVPSTSRYVDRSRKYSAEYPATVSTLGHYAGTFSLLE
jgi:hypothetical protein